MSGKPGPEPEPVRDYPAAHSMDTTWFAVDKDGHVGCFESGEAGAVPLAALGPEEDVLGTLPDAVPPTDVIHDIEGHVVGGKDAGHHLPAPPDGSIGVLVFLDALDPVSDEIAKGRAREVKAWSGFAVVFEKIPIEVFRGLHETARCRACFWHLGSRVDDDDLPDPAALGLFAYAHMSQFENWISGLYGCERRPDRPLKVEDLPPRLQKAIGKARFHGLRFAETPRFQPIEHADCETWECAYVTDDGKRVRAVPGREEEWASTAADTREVARDVGLEWDAPEPPPARAAPVTAPGPALFPTMPSRRRARPDRRLLAILSVLAGAGLALLIRACER